MYKRCVCQCDQEDGTNKKHLLWSGHHRFPCSPLHAFACMTRQARFAREKHCAVDASVLPCAPLLNCETFVPDFCSPSHTFGPLFPWSFLTRINMLHRGKTVATMFADKRPSIRSSSLLFLGRRVTFCHRIFSFLSFLCHCNDGPHVVDHFSVPKGLLPMILLPTSARRFNSSRLALHTVSCLCNDFHRRCCRICCVSKCCIS